jgi:hypothetical protein
LVLITFGFLWPVIFSGGAGSATTVDDPVEIADYTASYTVDAAGRLDAVETITGEFPSGRHGIFRYWDVANPNSPRVRQVPQIESILMDGEPAPYRMLWEDGERFRVAKIGSPDVTLDWGRHVFEIRYHIDGVLDPGKVGADKRFASTTGRPLAETAFYWNVIAPSWNNIIHRVNITVTLPAKVVGAQCAVGYGTGRECTDLTVRGDTVTLRATGLQPRTPVTLRAGIDMPTPARTQLLWPYQYDRVLGQSPVRVVVLIGLSVLAGAAAVWAHRATVEPAPGFPLQYAPPPGLGPVQCEYIRTEAVPKDGLTATLFYLAERKLVDLRQVNKKQWNVTGIAKPAEWADVDQVSVAVGSALKVIGQGTEFEAKKTATAGK